MKNAIIFHGTECKPDDFWYQSIKSSLEADGYEVKLPFYENINLIPLEDFLPSVLESHELNEETVLIGHSAGAPLILSILEQSSVQVNKVVLVAGFSLPLNGENVPILQSIYEWDKIKSNSKDFLIINSVNDPFGCDDKQGRVLFDNLGGTFIIRNDGHFGSSQDKDFKEFPLLERLLR